MDRVEQIKQLLREYPRDELDNLIYPENPDIEPEWVALRDELVELTGNHHLRARYRTKREYDQAVEHCEFVARRSMIQPSEYFHDIALNVENGRFLSVTEYAERWNTSIGNASKKIKRLAEQGKIALETHNRRKLVKCARVLAKAA